MYLHDIRSRDFGIERSPNLNTQTLWRSFRDVWSKVLLVFEWEFGARLSQYSFWGALVKCHLLCLLWLAWVIPLHGLGSLSTINHLPGLGWFSAMFIRLTLRGKGERRFSAVDTERTKRGLSVSRPWIVISPTPQGQDMAVEQQ